MCAVEAGEETIERDDQKWPSQDDDHDDHAKSDELYEDPAGPISAAMRACFRSFAQRPTAVFAFDEVTHFAPSSLPFA